MTISVFDLFTIGIGPSSSHTVGPMRAANQFVVALRRRGHLDDLEAMRVDLFGSLAATGAGHGTMSAILLGLEGCQPETITTEHKERRLAEIAASGVTRIGGVIPVPLTERDIDLHPDIVLPTHPNGMTFTAAGPHGRVLATETYFSVGGGFIVTEQTSGNSGQHPCSVALPYVSAQELLDICDRLDVSISEAALRNETCCRTENEVRAALLHLRDVMVECEQRSIAREGLLPGGLRVRRRAKVWYDRLNAEDPTRKPEFAEDWVNLVALAVNEENASGGRVVTAPTNGAAPSPGWCRSPASNATRFPPARPSTPHGWHCAATASIASPSTRSSTPCAPPARTCTPSTRKPRPAGSPSTSQSTSSSVDQPLPLSPAHPTG
ncbi:l-serine dehydratase SdaA [Mycobacterium tuberculosis M1415]|nr:l-serine dehydratase SdaA [Mycobacterium tuberculosis M1415]